MKDLMYSGSLEYREVPRSWVMHLTQLKMYICIVITDSNPEINLV